MLSVVKVWVHSSCKVISDDSLLDAVVMVMSRYWNSMPLAGLSTGTSFAVTDGYKVCRGCSQSCGLLSQIATTP